MKLFRHFLLIGFLFFWMAPSLKAQEPASHHYIFKTEPERTALLELYTSEGCSSCPPAHEWFTKLKKSERIWVDFVPVAFHVDYWDSQGWKDNLSNPEATRRQRVYARFWGANSIFTPAMMLNGEEWTGWSKGIDVYNAPKLSGVMTVERFADDYAIKFVPAEGLEGKNWVANIALLGFNIRSKIDDGENRGRVLENDFAVLAFKTHKMEKYSSGSQARINLSTRDSPILADKYGLAVWVNAEDNPLPVQAAGGFAG